jgi:hypothetical protein
VKLLNSSPQSTPNNKDKDDLTAMLRMLRLGKILTGLITVFLIAASLVVITKLDDINSQLKAKLSGDEKVRAAYEEVSKLRHEEEMKELHEIKVKLDYYQAIYQDDVRRGFQPSGFQPTQPMQSTQSTQPTHSPSREN